MTLINKRVLAMHIVEKTKIFPGWMVSLTTINLKV